MKNLKEAIQRATQVLNELNSNTFTIEGDDYGVKIMYAMPNNQFTFYTDIKDIGRKGKRVEEWEYSIWSPNSSVAWGATGESKLRNVKSFKKAIAIIKALVKEAEQEDSITKGNIPNKPFILKGVDKRLPEPSFATKFTDKQGRNNSIFFEKPVITINGKDETESANKGYQVHYIEIPWSSVKKVNLIADELVKASSLNGAEKILKANKIKFNTVIRMQFGMD